MVPGWRRLERLRAKLARWRYAPRITHPAFTRPLLGAAPLPLSRLTDCPAPDRALLSRIVACYAAGHALNAATTPSMWDEHAALRSRFVAALAAGDLDALAPMLGDLFGGVLLDGMSHGNSLFADESRNPYGRGFVGLRTLDCLLALGEACGEVSVPCYAQMKLDRYVATMRGDHAALLARLEARLGFSLAMPAVGSPYVVALGGTSTAPDVLRHAALAHRLATMGFGRDARVLEIGGGFGMFALCARRAGIGSVTIIDLPFVNAIQMFYLGSALAPAEVSGVGEAPAPLRLLPPDSISTLADGAFDVVVNCDSLPELGRETALAYLREVRRLAPLFVSINQESAKVHGGAAQHRVSDLAAEAGGWRRLSRHRAWMEQGYVEEVYARG